MISDEAIHVILFNKRIYLEDRVGSIVKSEAVEFVGKRNVKDCHVQGLRSANHRCLGEQKRSLRVNGVDQPAIQSYCACVLLDFLDSTKNTSQISL